MTKRRDRRPGASAPTPVASRREHRAVDLAAVAVAVLCVALAWAARGNLNVDGAAYLDLADRLRTADWGSFVQGYWSPAYPFLLAIVLAVTGTSGSDAVAVAHFVNLAVALGAVAILWRGARSRIDPTWGLLALTAFLVASARTVRLDAVTPDLLLLATMTGFGVELTRPAGWRGHRLGVWAGAAFLAKTSVWPWLCVAAGVGLLAVWRQPSRRGDLARGVAIAALPLLLWAGAVSVEAKRPMVSSTGPLSACWYLLSCDGRTPDSHRGAHEDYHIWLLGASASAQVATFGESRWTYAPWSDPTAWQQRLISQHRALPTVAQLVIYVGRQAGLVIGVWLPLLILGVLLPSTFGVRGAPSMRHALHRPVGVAMLLGLVGILQFVAVHAEPRLIAPFAMLLAIGWISWRLEGTPTRWLRHAAAGALVLAIGIGGWHLRDQLRVTASSVERTRQLETGHPPHAAPHRVAVVGPALPMMPDLYRARAVVVAQVMEPDPAALAAWPPPAVEALRSRLREMGVTTLWISRGRSAYRILPLGQGPSGTP